MDYIELRCRSAFSFLAGAALPEELIERAAALSYPVLALGDRDGVYGAPRFHQAARQAGLRAIVSCAVTGAGNLELYLLVADRVGYRNLCRLLTETKLRVPKGESAAAWSDLEGRTEGLICLAGGGDGPLASAVGRRDDATAGAVLRRLQSLFPGRLYIDLQRHLDPEEERFNRALLALARRHDVPVVATNDVRHATPHGRRLLDVLTCLREKTTLDAAGRRLLSNAERHLKSAREMTALFGDCPDALANTRRIAERCEFTLDNLGYRFPAYPTPPGQSPIGYLRELTYAGARERYGTLTPRIRRQLEHELSIIGQLDLAGYFLIVWDLVRYCRAERILAQGRGSAANSAVCYSLGITAVDPIGMELLFERFLSTERGEWPDIDIDLPSGDQREKVIQYIYRRYGERGAAMTANVITYRTRSAVREVGKVLGFGPEQVDRLSKLLRRFEFSDEQDDLARQLEAGGVDPAAPRVRLLVDLVGRIKNLPRHLGQHSGGMVIAAGRLDEVVPLEPATMPGRVVVQWDKDDCADLGIIKVDMLGLGMLAVLEEAIPLVREHEGVEIDLAHLPPDDPAVYRMLRRGDTIGVFQVESRAQMATLPRMKPERFYDLVVEVAIIRPGPIVGKMVHPYLDRRNGRAPVTYDHPLLEPILARTLGVPLFQEQVLRMAMAVAGFNAGEAEELRRAMGFKRSQSRMQMIETRLRQGMQKQGVTGAAADAVVRSITSFALYGFPESHAASFALITYASAYLRAHHLAAFTCAMLNNWPLGFYHPATLVKDAQRHGLRVLPVDVTHSNWQCTLERQPPPLPLEAVGFLRNGPSRRRRALRDDADASPQGERKESNFPSPALQAGEGEGEGTFRRGGAVVYRPSRRKKGQLALRLGLRYVVGLRREAVRRLEAARAGAPFISIADAAARAQLRDDELETLAHIGAFAAFGLTRRQALWQVAAVRREPLFRKQGVGALGHCAARGSSDSLADNALRLSPLPEMALLDRTLADYRGTGITIGPHLMRHLRERLAAEGVVRICDLPRMRDGSWVKVAGLVIVRQRPGTAKGFCFLTLEDETGIGNAVVVPDQFRRHRSIIHSAPLLLVEGLLQKACPDPGQGIDGVIHVRARRFRALELPERTVAQTGRGYRMRVTPQERPVLPKSHDFR